MNRAKIFFCLIAIFIFSQFCLAEKILIVGDSHSCGQFGSTLLKELSKKGHEVQLFCTVSSSPVHWLNGNNPGQQTCKSSNSTEPDLKFCGKTGKVPRLDDILSQDSYDSAIIALGTNSLYSSQANSTYSELAEKVFTKTSSCYWVAPPHLRPEQAKASNVEQIDKMEKNLLAFYVSLENRVSPFCQLLTSLNSTELHASAGDTLDGVHRTANSGQAWALDILSKLFK